MRPLSLPRLSAVLVEPENARQIFNDTDADALWLVVGAPPEAANTLETTDEQTRHPCTPTTRRQCRRSSKP